MQMRCFSETGCWEACSTGDKNTNTTNIVIRTGYNFAYVPACDPIYGMEFTGGFWLLVTRHSCASFCVWDTDTGELMYRLTTRDPQAGQDSPTSGSWAVGMHGAVVICTARVLQTWDANTGKTLQCMPVPFVVHGSRVRMLAATPRAHRVLLETHCELRSYFYLCDPLHAGPPVCFPSIREDIESQQEAVAAISEDASTVILCPQCYRAGRELFAYVHSGTTGERLRQINLFSGGAIALYSIAISGDGVYWLTQFSGSVRVYEAASGLQVAGIDTNDAQQVTQPRFRGRTGASVLMYQQIMPAAAAAQPEIRRWIPRPALTVALGLGMVERLVREDGDRAVRSRVLSFLIEAD